VSSATLPYDTAEALVKSGFSVGVICGYPKEYNNNKNVPKKENHESIEIRRLKYIQLSRSYHIGRLVNYFSFTFSVAIHFLSLSNYKSIIVYSNPPVLPYLAALASKFFRVEVIFVSYDIYPEIAQITNSISESSVLFKIMECLNKTIFKYVTKVVALSNEMKSYLLKHRSYLKDNQINVISNWYEDKEIKDSSISYENNLFKDINPKENFIVSYFGNMGICQDIETILGAIRELRNDDKVKFLFAGHGNKIETLRDCVRQENLKNTFIYDFLHGQDYQDALNISDCFLVSLAEGITGLAVPSKSYSYMMAGKPIIAIMGEESDIAKDLKENKAGYTMRVGEISKLIHAIKELRNNEDELKCMGQNSRKVFLQKYTKEICTQQYIEMMKRILEG
jgi:glycosyltransferase involved in cell wall biosynthesis